MGASAPGHQRRVSVWELDLYYKITIKFENFSEIMKKRHHLMGFLPFIPKGNDRELEEDLYKHGKRFVSQKELI